MSADLEYFEYRKRIMDLFSKLGKKIKCRACGEYIWMLPTKNGRALPVNDDGVVHFSTCPYSVVLKHD